MTFEEWLLTKHGRECLGWPVSDIQYLRNRLWWAFQAGLDAGKELAEGAPTSNPETKP
jgi:hypothetical protein